MLGMTKTQELWRAREEMGTKSWASEKFLKELDIIQTMRKNDKPLSGIFFGSVSKAGRLPGVSLDVETPQCTPARWTSSAVPLMTYC